MQSISILGCGWLGERIGISFLKKSWVVNASSRNENRLKEISKIGFQSFQLDIEDSTTLHQDFFAADYLIIATTNKNVSAHQRLLEVITKSQIKKVFFISSTSVYKKTKNAISIDSPLIDSPLVEIEKVYLTSKNIYILRCGGLVGDNRQPGNFFKKGATIKNPDGIVKLIHYEEIISMINSLLVTDNQQVIHNLIRESIQSRFEFYSNAYRDLHGENGNFSQ